MSHALTRVTKNNGNYLIMCYVDQLLIATPTLEDHIERLDEMLACIEVADLKNSSSQNKRSVVEWGSGIGHNIREWHVRRPRHRRFSGGDFCDTPWRARVEWQDHLETNSEREQSPEVRKWSTDENLSTFCSSCLRGEVQIISGQRAIQFMIEQSFLQMDYNREKEERDLEKNNYKIFSQFC